MAVLVDSSVWIAASNTKNKECLTLKRLIKNNELIYILKPIQVEVCQGAKTQKQFEALWEAFLGFEFLELTDRLWGLSAWNYFVCRKKGLKLGTLDCLIGTVAKEHGVQLWTLDKTLLKAKPIIGFDIQVY